MCKQLKWDLNSSAPLNVPYPNLNTSPFENYSAGKEQFLVLPPRAQPSTSSEGPSSPAALFATVVSDNGSFYRP
ncbi:hypothetical protein F2Q69_00026916 [Brassica cretica]|uniref:Uncharacterized protein n=1 Tax=Brassica cretica TaxID=69181 RepID=A0A8S9RUI7_BRACR|nr:hypothetical protein F2Q69_00026916 [Brassica cretica]